MLCADVAVDNASFMRLSILALTTNDLRSAGGDMKYLTRLSNFWKNEKNICLLSLNAKTISV